MSHLLTQIKSFFTSLAFDGTFRRIPIFRTFWNGMNCSGTFRERRGTFWEHSTRHLCKNDFYVVNKCILQQTHIIQYG
jgi:hypothetical protein